MNEAVPLRAVPEDQPLRQAAASAYAAQVAHEDAQKTEQFSYFVARSRKRFFRAFHVEKEPSVTEGVVDYDDDGIRLRYLETVDASIPLDAREGFALLLACPGCAKDVIVGGPVKDLAQLGFVLSLADELGTGWLCPACEQKDEATDGRAKPPGPHERIGRELAMFVEAVASGAMPA